MLNTSGSSCLSFPVGMTSVSNGRDQQAGELSEIGNTMSC